MYSSTSDLISFINLEVLSILNHLKVPNSDHLITVILLTVFCVFIALTKFCCKVSPKVTGYFKAKCSLDCDFFTHSVTFKTLNQCCWQRWRTVLKMTVVADAIADGT